MYCKHCGALINDDAVICVKCGRAITEVRAVEVDPNVSEKSGVVTLLLAVFLGSIGIHSFYVGRTAIGIAQLFTLGGCGIWVLIDIIMLAIGSYTDGEGRVVKL